MADITSLMNNETSTISSLMDQYGVKADEGTTSTGLDKDAFLNLLATQMQYQDPLEPQSNEDMLAQMAQFSALEQMQNINSSTLMQQAYALMGKNVLGVAESDVVGSSEYVEGVVEAVTLKNGEAYVRVDGKDIALSNVEAVMDNSAATSASYAEAIEKINETLETINDKLDQLTGAQADSTDTEDSTDTSETTESSDSEDASEASD